MSKAGLFWILDGVMATQVALAIAVAVSVGSNAPAVLGFSLIWVIVASILRAATQTRAAIVGNRIAADEKRRRRVPVFAALLSAAPGTRRMLGEQIADATDRIEDLDGYHARFRPLRFAATATPLLIAAATAFASWISALILLATLVPFAFGMAFAGAAAGRAAGQQLEALNRLSGLFIDRVRALPVILGFSAQGRIARHLGSATQEAATRTMSVLRVAFLSGAVIEFFSAISVALVAVYCGFNLLRLLPFPVPEQLDLPRALFVLILAPEFYLPMRRLAAAYHDKQVGEAARDRLDSAVPEAAAVGEAPALPASPSVRYDGVVIDYGERQVGPFSLTVPAGQVTALSGPTGTGKSSLLHALLGLAPVAGGTLSVDGAPLEGAGLRGAVSWAGQAVALIPGTLADNIRLARPQADDAAVADAARRAGLTPLIDSRAGGLQAPIEATGSGLSGGERRRIGLARALLRDAPLWLLDEPTADLDEKTAEQVMQALFDAARGRTVLLVTHSPAAIALAENRIALA